MRVRLRGRLPVWAIRLEYCFKFRTTRLRWPQRVLKKCKKPDDVLFTNAAEHFVKGKRQNQLTDAHIEKILKTYQSRSRSRQPDLACVVCSC